MLDKICEHDNYFREYALKICKDINLRDDLVQEMYLKFNRYDQAKLGEMIDKGVIKFVGVRVLKQIFIDGIRARRETEQITDIDILLDPADAEHENWIIEKKRKLIKRQLDCLNDYEYKMFMVYINEEMSMRALSAATSIPLKEIWRTINRAVVKLKENIEKPIKTKKDE